MLHEALLNLWNCPDDFCNSKDEDEWFCMIELRDFIHPGEKKILLQIAHIALDYHYIQRFIKSVLADKLNTFESQSVQEVFQGTSSKLSNEELLLRKHTTEADVHKCPKQIGLYLKAFCKGLDLVLEDYRNDIIDLEQTILINPNLPLTYILSHVDKYSLIFNAYKSMIRTIRNEQLHGCVLVGRLIKYHYCGVKQVADAALRIVCTINNIFYRHLCNWIIFGDLVDIHQEFFICDAKCSDEDFSWSVSTNDARSDIDSLSENTKGYKLRKPPKVRKFYLRENMLPSNITLELAQIILFMGRMVWIIRNDPSTNNNELKLNYKRDVWEGKETYYFNMLQDLGKKSFSLALLEKAIDDCRICITKYLWKVMVEEVDLVNHLKLFRDYYAMGRGELFQQFIMAIQEKCRDTPDEYMAFKMNTIFTETAKKLYSENDKTHERFEICFPEYVEMNIRNNWLQIEMNFEVVWPLHIIFHPGAMKLYNKLFNFLLRIKKCQYDLEKLWLTHMEGKHNIHTGVWTLRNTLMFIINNIQYYMQVDVIEVQFAELIKSVTSTKNVENIIKLHAEFLGNLISRTFLMNMNEDNLTDSRSQLYKLPALEYETTQNNRVYSIILSFLELCDEFCKCASNWSIELNEIERLELEKLQVNFDRLIEQLLVVLYSLREHTSGNHLLQLLYRIDFNRWFSKNSTNSHLSIL